MKISKQKNMDKHSSPDENIKAQVLKCKKIIKKKSPSPEIISSKKIRE